jgi:hypothetical protein
MKKTTTDQAPQPNAPKKVDDNVFYLLRSTNEFNRCLSVFMNSVQDGAKVVQNDCKGTDNQLWKLEKREDGKYYIIAKHSNMVMDIEDPGNQNHNLIVQKPRNDSRQATQLWKLQTNEGGSHVYYIINPATKKHLTLWDPSPQVDGLLQLHDGWYPRQQSWSFQLIE